MLSASCNPCNMCNPYNMDCNVTPRKSVKARSFALSGFLSNRKFALSGFVSILVIILFFPYHVDSTNITWRKAHATFYGGSDASGTMGGACGYGNLYSQGYGTDSTALSTALFNEGAKCGACYAIMCYQSTNCYKNFPIIRVTATNFCPPNYDLPNDNGGWCNPPWRHFDLSQPAFSRIAVWRAGIIPVLFRRVPCTKTGSIRYTINGNKFFNLVHVTNVGGAGDVTVLSVKGSNTDWIPMIRNWGMNWQTDTVLYGRALSFRITTSDQQSVTVLDVVPSNWEFSQTFEGGQFGRL